MCVLRRYIIKQDSCKYYVPCLPKESETQSTSNFLITDREKPVDAVVLTWAKYNHPQLCVPSIFWIMTRMRCSTSGNQERGSCHTSLNPKRLSSYIQKWAQLSKFRSSVAFERILSNDTMVGTRNSQSGANVPFPVNVFRYNFVTIEVQRITFFFLVSAAIQ